MNEKSLKFSEKMEIHLHTSTSPLQLGNSSAKEDHVIQLNAPEQLLNGPHGEMDFISCCF